MSLSREAVLTTPPEKRPPLLIPYLQTQIAHVLKVAPSQAYLWSLNTFGTRQQGEFLEFKSLLFLTQALGKHKISDRLQLWVVSNNIQEVNGNETLDPEKATVLGLCKVIPQEYPNITCRSIDFVLTNRRDAESAERGVGDCQLVER